MNPLLETVAHGAYICARCRKGYCVNDGTWRLCTPEFCHDCLEHLEKQHAFLPYPEPKH